MSAAVEPTQPTDEAVELAGEVFYGPVWDGADSHAGVEVRAALAAAYPVMVKQAIADAERERDKARAHILDIDAHATPFGDIPDDPGWVGTYLVTAGALHRALGTIGHTAPSCQAEAQVAAVRARLDQSEWVVSAEIQDILARAGGGDHAAAEHRRAIGKSYGDELREQGVE